ncbi:hypothetical protein [Streptomyces sp. CBMAI 2042]|uniref:hypothetical protein n=1 Tax=Streptomyces sp. CBMAI 2042 TaxID=2305222 RepID=UPI001F2558A8|nr:hypothetical protein [Streptomyces sp. CBMAI 2042]
MDESLSAQVESLLDATIAVGEAAETVGWSPSPADDTLSVVDVLCAMLAAHGGPLKASLTEIRAHIKTAQRALREDLPPAPRRGSAAARQEDQDGTSRFRAWRDARVHQWPAPPRARRHRPGPTW